jgi:hypothetical protein
MRIVLTKALVKYNLPKLQKMPSFGRRGFNPLHKKKTVEKYDRKP